MRTELQSVLDLVRTLPASELPAVLGELEQIRATAQARLFAPATAVAPDESLDVDEAARRLGVSADFLYRHSSKYKFVRREGRRLVFSARGLDAYLSKPR